jgi:type II secretory pathway component PulK
VTERALVYGVALLVVALALATMAAMHENHYKRRRWQLLEGRVASLERIIVGEHD